MKPALINEIDPEVLVLGKTPGLMPHAIEALRNEGINTAGIFHESEAHIPVRSTTVKIIAIGGGVPIQERQTLRNWLAKEAPQVRILEIAHISILAETIKAVLTQPQPHRNTTP